MFNLTNELKRKISFDCNSCNGICCFNPPTLVNTEEVKRALEHKVLTVFFESLPGQFLVAVAKSEKHKCPFLDENGKCKIYNNRFQICKEYKCSVLRDGYTTLEDMLITGKFLKNETLINKSQPPFISEKELKSILNNKKYQNYIFKTNDVLKASEKIYGVPTEIFLVKMEEIIIRNLK